MSRVAYWMVLSLLVIGCADLPTGSSAHSVINGDPVMEGSFPATGALHAAGEVSCTGTLVSPTVVITAAHCVDPTFLGDEVPGFTLALDGTAPDVHVVPGASAHKHPGFDLFSDPDPGVGQWFDIGVLNLAEPITGVEYERLPSPEEAERNLVADAQVSIVGYGLSSNDSFDYGIKLQGQATLVEVGTHELLIAEPGEQQNCNGDSGGPALVDVPGDTRRLFGVVSRAPDDNLTCDHGGIDTRVDPYIEWIVSVAPQLCEELECGADGVPRPPAPEPEPDPDPNPVPSPMPGTSDGGCSVATGSQSASWLLGVALFALVAGRRRRRRRRRSVG